MPTLLEAALTHVVPDQVVREINDEHHAAGQAMRDGLAHARRVSVLPYPSLSPHKIKLAMKIGGEYLVKKIGARQWEKLALDVRINSDDLLSRVTRSTERVADVVHRVCQEAERDGLHHPIVKRFEEAVATRAAACTQALSAGTRAPTNVTPESP